MIHDMLQSTIYGLPQWLMVLLIVWVLIVQYSQDYTIKGKEEYVDGVWGIYKALP